MVDNQNQQYTESLFGVPLTNQLACYDGDGAGYIAHRDTPRKDAKAKSPLLYKILQAGLDTREITLILYLNAKTTQV